RVVTVATGSGYWLENSWPTKRIVWWLWFVVVPLTIRLVGYFPGKRLRKVGNLPKGVMAQWRRWCLDREYVVGAEGDHVRAAYASVRTPILSLSFTDDEMMSAQGVRSLHSLYAGAPIEYRRIAPRDIGVTKSLRFLPSAIPGIAVADRQRVDGRDWTCGRVDAWACRKEERGSSWAETSPHPRF